MLQRKALIEAIAILIAVVWATSVLYTYIDHEYRPPPTVHLVMMAMVGGVFGAKVFQKVERNEQRNDSDRR